MSDLFCPVSIVLARHGEAEYEAPVVGNLGGSLTMRGRDQAAELARSLADRRVAMIYSSSLARAVQTAEIAAAVLAVPVRVRHELREFEVGDFAGLPFALDVFAPVFARWSAGDLSTGCPGAETGADVVRRVSGELESVADQHRGETVLVVSHGGAIQLTAPAVAPGIGDVWEPDRWLGYCGTAELEGDADGWQCHSWAGEQLGGVGGAR